MNQHAGTTPHLTEDQVEALLLGTASSSDIEAIESHLATCDDCRDAWGDPLALIQALPFAAPDVDYVPVDHWDAIAGQLDPPASPLVAPAAPQVLAAVPAQQSKGNVVPLRRPRPSWAILATVAAACLVIGLLAGMFAPWGRSNDSNAQQFSLQFTDPQATASGTLDYLPDQQIFVLDVSGLPAAPNGYVYQAWLINDQGPVPSGVLSGDGSKIAVRGDLGSFTTFAVTLEPGPLGVAAPTSQPVLVADLSSG